MEKLNFNYQANTKRQRPKDKGQKTKGFNKIAFVKNQLSEKEILMCDLALADFNDLIDPAFKNWFCKCYYQIGEMRVRQLASEARQEGNNPAHLFRRLIKLETLRIKIN